MKEAIYEENLSVIRCKDTLSALSALRWRLMFDQVDSNNLAFFAFRIWPSCSYCKAVELATAAAPMDFCQSSQFFQ